MFAKNNIYLHFYIVLLYLLFITMKFVIFKEIYYILFSKIYNDSDVLNMLGNKHVCKIANIDNYKIISIYLIQRNSK